MKRLASHNRIAGVAHRTLHLALCPILLCPILVAGIALQVMPHADAQGYPGWRPTRSSRPRINKPPRRAVVVDPVALALLKKVFHHTADFVGMQKTQTGSKMSVQKVMEDTYGHRRLEYLEPHEFQGNILLSTANEFYNYHARENRTDVAYWPVNREAKEQIIFNMVKRGVLTLAITGQEAVLGRQCAILTLSSQRPGTQAETQRRIWVDNDSGIVLRNERWNAHGQISTSYMTDITIGPEAGVSAKDFNPGLLPKTAKSDPMFPAGRPPFATVAQAQVQAGFHIMEPEQLPTNYALDGVWVFGRGRGTSVLLRYTLGVDHFSLFERPAYKIMPAQLNRPYRHSAASIQRWPAQPTNGIALHMIYIGHLSEDEVQALHDSLK